MTGLPPPSATASSEVEFIAEIGLNHNGNFDLACEMIRQAESAGADVVKFQLGWRGKRGEINHITPDILTQLIDRAGFCGVEIMFSIFTEEAFEMLRNHDLPRYKIASRMVKDRPRLVESIVAEGKETLVSLGMWEGNGLPMEGADNVRYLWCKSSYPAYPEELRDLPADFRNSPYAGISDHSLGIETPLLAVARGARIVEKHFTLDKSDTTIRDHALSATPGEFREMVAIGRRIGRLVAFGL